LGRLLDAGRKVEALGFDGCFIFDHPAVQADPWVCLPRWPVSPNACGLVQSSAVFRTGIRR